MLTNQPVPVNHRDIAGIQYGQRHFQSPAATF